MTVAEQRELPLLPEGFEYRLELARAATPRDLKDAPRHRWFYFPHSYSPRLLHEVVDYWGLPSGSLILDPFVGAGTTLLVARERGFSAIGFDLSPLAILVSNVKVRDCDPVTVQRALQEVTCRAAANHEGPAWDSDRLSRAFTPPELSKLWALVQAIRLQPAGIRDLLVVALLRVASLFSRAVPNGGWFRWQEWPDRSDEILGAFRSAVLSMIEDMLELSWQGSSSAGQAKLADARRLPLQSSSVDAVITSPPYANRHDYSRVFHIDLLMLGLPESLITKLRHCSIRSHVEAKAPKGYRRRLGQYRTPESLQSLVNLIPRKADRRILPLLKGYFEDMYLSLVEVGRVLRAGGRAAYVVGNVRHAGVMVPADVILSELAPQAGLELETGWVLRLRGNSAQQMGQYGRQPARETVVLLRKA